MKILFVSYTFHPAVGGIESSALLLLKILKQRGHTVRVITAVPLDGADELPWPEVIRRPCKRQQWQLGRWAEVMYHHNPAFTYWLPSLTGRPTVCSIRTWVSRTDGRLTWRDRVKRRVLRSVPCIANSKATAHSLADHPRVIENAYDDSVFVNHTPWRHREGAAFVGRLVSDKGVPTALAALAEAGKHGHPLPIKIIGSGPEEAALKQQAKTLGLDASFLGRLTPEQVATELQSVKYLLVPSKWAEPFGIVALEGIACGCIPLGTNQGGLVDAIGPCGPLFPKENAAALAKELIRLESDPTHAESFRQHHAPHLAAHAPETVADRYLEVFENAIKR